MAENTAGQTLSGNTPSMDAPQRAFGKDVFDATAITATDYVEIDVGFKPKYVCWENNTDRIRVEWFEGMADDSCIKTAANGTRTLEVTGGNKGITVINKGFQLSQNATLAAIAASKTCTWMALG